MTGVSGQSSLPVLKHPECKPGMTHEWGSQFISHFHNWPASNCRNGCGVLKLWP